MHLGDKLAIEALIYGVTGAMATHSHCSRFVGQLVIFLVLVRGHLTSLRHSTGSHAGHLLHLRRAKARC